MPPTGWSRLLDYLLNTRGFDFRGYKAPGLVRRVRKRMAEARVDGFAEYQDFLEVHPEEFATLFDTILINVTTFFRDPEAWEVIRNTILPRVVATKSVGEPIRIWSAGCASGEEAYTLAMVLAEMLGEEEFRKPGEDLRHRHRRPGAQPCAPARVSCPRGAGHSAAAARQVSHPGERGVRIP